MRFGGLVGLGETESSLVVSHRAGLGAARVVALSFDDGPSEHTPAVLDLLRQHGARASFFVIGQEVAGREALVRRMLREGHEIGNHTWSHPVPSQISDAELRAEIARTNDGLEAAVSVRPRLMRPPYFDDPARVARIAHELGLERTVLGFMVGDWKDTSPEAIARRVVRRAKPGRIIVLHDAYRTSRRRGDPSITVRAVAQLLPALSARGYRIVTVSELFAA